VIDFNTQTWYDFLDMLFGYIFKKSNQPIKIDIDDRLGMYIVLGNSCSRTSQIN